MDDILRTEISNCLWCRVFFQGYDKLRIPENYLKITEITNDCNLGIQYTTKHIHNRYDTVCNLNLLDSSGPSGRSGCLIILMQQSDFTDLVNNVGLLVVLLLNR